MAETTVSDPIIDLVNDHRNVEILFRRFDATEGDERNEVLQEIVAELERHAKIEEQAIYPALRDLVAGGEEEVQHAMEEHEEVKQMLREVAGKDGNDPEVAAVVQALANNVTAHAEEEESGLLMAMREQIPPAKFTEIAEAAAKAREAAGS